MLLELIIRNFAIIDELRLQFGPGFSALTGETGAGKSIIIDGVNLLLGGRANSAMVRTGAKRAQIEGVFTSPDSAAAILDREQLWGDEPDHLVLAREVRTNGRSVSRINGRIVTLGILRQVSATLVDIHGQSEHLSLMRVREHINLLDRYAGLGVEREELAKLVRQLQAARPELKQLLRDERELARRVDLLNYQIKDIQSARLQPGEDKDLRQERIRLANAEQLAALADKAYTCLQNQVEDMPAVQDLLGGAVRALAGLAKIDPGQADLREATEQISYQVDELSDRLRDYREQIEFNPRRLELVQDRIEIIRRLQRKYGDSIEEVLAWAQRAAAELDTIIHSKERIVELEAQEEQLLEAIGEAGAALSARRRAAAAELGTAVERELADLRMEGARFGANVRWRPDPAGAFVPGSAERVAFDARGLDQVEFLISPNPGESLKPMVKIASGGETARLMLAIKTVLSRADQTPTLIFDEIDQGIGGRVGQIVGQKLWGLAHKPASDRQVICITHLPQLAGFGNTHFRVEKRLADGRTVTRVQRLETPAERVSELAQMLGGETPATRDSAREILEQVQSYVQAE